MAHTGRYHGSKGWQGTVIIENATQTDPRPAVRPAEGPRYQQRAAGSLQLLKMATNIAYADYFFYGTNWSLAANSQQQGPWSYASVTSNYGPVGSLSPVRFLARMAEWSARGKFTSGCSRGHIRLRAPYGLKRLYTYGLVE